MNYAGFWKRTAAYLIDYLIYGIIVWLVMIPLMLLTSFSIFDITWSNLGIGLGICFVVFIGYYAWPESSPWQATIGKKIFGLRVATLQGQRISFIRSIGRNLALIVSALFTLYISLLMCLWTQKKQCLHDMMSGCLVLDDIPDKRHGLAIGISVGIFVLYGLLELSMILIPSFIQTTAASAKEEAAVWFMYKTEIKQETYYEKHHAYATNWNLLDIEECKQETGSECTIIDDIKVSLLDDGVSIHWPPSNELSTKYEEEDINCSPDSVCQALAKAGAELAELEKE